MYIMSDFSHDQMIEQIFSDEAATSSAPLKKKARHQWRKIGSVLGVFVLVGGVIAAVLAAQTNLDLRQFAWGGVRTNQAALQGQSMSLEEYARQQSSSTGLPEMFTALTKTYFDADVVNIEEPDFQVTGVVFKKYDVDIDQTFIYARLVNLPLIGAVPALWMQDDSGAFVQAGIGEVIVEAEKPVGYFATVLEGDVTGYTTAHFSYDGTVQQIQPSSIFLSVDFFEDEE